jgi:alpha-beta hydrolase superfamily lysophospholipase
LIPQLVGRRIFVTGIDVRRRYQALLTITVIAALAVLMVAHAQLPGLGAGGLLHPGRQMALRTLPSSCGEASFAGDGVTLRGWRCASATPARGTIIYLHGIADNRGSAAGAIERYTARGFDVIAYDSRAHGQSGGDACTYGFFEKRDLRAVVDGVRSGPITLIGTSLGAAVALQGAADDPRIAVVVAAETFSDLRTVATERAPFFFTATAIDRALRLAEEQGRFDVDAAAPVVVAPRIKAAVLLIHGDADTETPPSHSQRVFDALVGPKRLLLVPGAGHNGSLRADVWSEIDRWIESRDAGGEAEREARSQGFRTSGSGVAISGSYRSRKTSRGKANLPAIESMMLIWQV